MHAGELAASAVITTRWGTVGISCRSKWSNTDNEWVSAIVMDLRVATIFVMIVGGLCTAFIMMLVALMLGLVALE